MLNRREMGVNMTLIGETRNAVRRRP